MSPLPDFLEFVFLWWHGHDEGVLLSRQYKELLDRYHLADSTARTWGEFIEVMGPYAAYLDDFMQYDEVEAEEWDTLDAIRHGVWVLNNLEFPITQCAQETFQFYGRHFPEFDDAVTIRTEYGMPLRLYPKSRYFELKAHLLDAGHKVSEEPSRVSMHIYAY
jgi:hypothetical protein